ncbi:LOW QUALITY PROTEIN: uncharacterized protein C6orf118 homolog [Pluvialis apricaria]
MERNCQVKSLAHLLDSVEMSYRTDVKLCTSGHLNHHKLYKPSEKINQGWYSAKKQTSFMTERNTFPAENERARKMKRFPGNFCSGVPLLPAQAESSCPNNRRPQSPVTADGASVDFSTPLEMLKLKALKKKVEEGSDRLHMCLKRDELDVSEVMVLKNKPVKNSDCVMVLAEEEYQFIPSYLAGVTKTEQFNKFLHSQKEFLANYELLNDFSGSKVLEQHERKLAKFEDICNSFLIFGDILKEIKSEYELYVMMLLDSLLIAQYKAPSLLVELFLPLVLHKANRERQACIEYCGIQDCIFKKISGSDAFAFAGMACDNLTDLLLPFQAETMKINSSNIFLQGQIKEVEGNITEILDKLRITQENQSILDEEPSKLKQHGREAVSTY